MLVGELAELQTGEPFRRADLTVEAEELGPAVGDAERPVDQREAGAANGSYIAVYDLSDRRCRQERRELEWAPSGPPMANTMGPPPQQTLRYIVWGGSVVLAGTAVFHAVGWPGVAAAANEAALSPFLSAAFKGLWLYASYHWLFVAVLAAVAVVHPSRLARIVLTLSAVLLAADAVLLLVATGPFIGEALLAVSISTYASGAFFLGPKP